MNARDDIFARVRAALATLPEKQPLPSYPTDVSVPRDGRPGTDRVVLVARFVERLESVRGRAFSDPRELGAWLAEGGATRGLCDPALLPRLEALTAPANGVPAGAGLRLEAGFQRRSLDDLDEFRFGITRAAGAIADTGTVILTDRGTSSRLAALAPWIHVAVLTPSQIYPHLADAIAALGDDPNVVWCTGPSKTADVEGILIEGVHGPGEQVALILPD